VPLSPSEKQRRYRERQKAKAAAEKASEDLVVELAKHEREESGPSPETAAQALGADEPSPPPADEPLPEEVGLTPEEPPGEETVIQGPSPPPADVDEAYLKTAEAMQRAYQDGYDGVAYPPDTPVELAVAWARGVWQRQANSQPVRADQAERDQRAREYAEWLKTKVDPPIPAGARADPHGPDLKPELAKQAAKAQKHPGGWDG